MMRNTRSMAKYWGLASGSEPSPIEDLPPRGYTQIGGIYSNNNTGFNTGVSISLDDEWIVKVTRDKSYGGNLGFIGGGKSSTDGNFAIWLNPDTNATQMIFGHNVDSVITTYDYDVSKSHTYRMKLGTGEAWIDGNPVGQVTPQTSFTASDVALCNIWRNGQLYGYSKYRGNIEYCKIIRNGTMIRDYRPVIRNSDNSVGLYDMCGSIDIATNTGTPYVKKGDAAISYDVLSTVSVPSDNPTWGFVVRGTDRNGGTIDWGDGIVEQLTGSSENISHTYDTGGDYLVHLDAPLAQNWFRWYLSGTGGYATELYRFASRYVPAESFSGSGGNMHTGQSVISHVGYVRNYGFAWNNYLNMSVVPAGITDFCYYSFAGCSAITSLRFPLPVNSVDSNAFARCSNLLDIYVPWSEGEIANAPWGATNATIHYNS